MASVNSRVPIVALLCESFFCGALNILFGISVYVVLFKKSRTRTTYVLLAVNVVLYAISVLHWIVNSVITLGVIPMGTAEELIMVWSPTINYILSDAVVVWRAWLIWERNTKICIPSIVCLLGTLASVVVSVVLEIQGTVSLALVSLLWGSFLGSNLWTTSIIAWRAWQHRRFIKNQLGEGTARTNAEKILCLLIESGAIYCCILSVSFGIYYNLRTAVDISSAIDVPLIAMYPLTIVIIVHLRATSSDLLSGTSSIDFVTPSDTISSGNPDSGRHSNNSG